MKFTIWVRLTSTVLHIEATATLRQAGTITGWRDELYPVTHAFDAPPAALIERAAAPYFGVKVVQTCSEEDRVPSSVTCVAHTATFQATSCMTRLHLVCRRMACTSTGMCAGPMVSCSCGSPADPAPSQPGRHCWTTLLQAARCAVVHHDVLLSALLTDAD